MKVSLIQMNSSCNKQQNLAKVTKLVESAVKQDKPQLVVLPEMFAFLGGCVDTRVENAESFEDFTKSPALSLLRDLALRHQITIHGGSICEKATGKYYNTTPVFSAKGELIAKYRKIHLFVVNIDDKITYREDDFYSAGDRLVTYNTNDHTVGCSTCYDLRFGEMYQQLRQQGAEVLMAPSAFISTTGQDHWEVLCRARAIETQSYLLAPNQTGNYTLNGNTRFTCGHSMIVDHWGRILAAMEEEEGFISAEIDLTQLNMVRRQLPVDESRRLRCLR